MISNQRISILFKVTVPSLPALKGYANLMNIIATIFGPFDGLQWSKTIDKCMENANSSSV